MSSHASLRSPLVSKSYSYSFARLATYGLKTSDGATLHVPASVATAADTAAVYVDRTRYESPLLLRSSSYMRGG